MSAQRMAQWLWWSGAAPARVARGVLLPFAFAYRTLMSARAGAYRKGWLRQRPLPLPAVAIGNLAVGGAGETPLAGWAAGFFARPGGGGSGEGRVGEEGRARGSAVHLKK